MWHPSHDDAPGQASSRGPPSPGKSGVGPPPPIPGKDASGDGDGDRGFRALPVGGGGGVTTYCDHKENRVRESAIGRDHCTQRGITASQQQRAEATRSVPSGVSA
jgi:hypothetical protein